MHRKIKTSSPAAGVLAASLLAIVMVTGGGCRDNKTAPPTAIDRPDSGGKGGSGGAGVTPDGSGGTGAPGSDTAAPADLADGTDTATLDGAGSGPMDVSCPADKKECNGVCIAPDAPCGDTCPAGKNLCGGACVDPANVMACGTSCTVCPTSPNGTATCNGDICDLTCAAGHHKCGDACVPDTDVATCGTSCSPCMKPTAGTATCDGKMCGATCPADTKLCGDACIGVNAPCMGACAADKHACNGLCVPNTDVNSCGTSCTTCPVPGNGTAACDGTTCGFTCKNTFHKCGSDCRSNTSIMSCGATSCDVCPTPANGVPTCDGTACGTRCNDGYHKCGTGAQAACKANNSELSCGTMCTPCETVGNGRPTCTAGKCDAICNPGFHKCNAQCIPDTQACGNTCGATFKFCGNGTCVAISSLTTEICDGKDNDCNLTVDDVDPVDCSNACAKGAKKVCKNGRLDDSACKPGPTPGNNLACGTVGGNKCEICAQGTTCTNGTCVVTTCPQGQRVCPAMNKCLPNETLCGNDCPDNFQRCGDKCISNQECCKATNPTCCTDMATHKDCGKCEKCVNRICVAQTGEDLKQECTGGTQADCNTGTCKAAGVCGFKDANMVCGATTATCDPNTGFITNPSKCPGNSGTCPTAVAQACPGETFCANSSCNNPKKNPGEACQKAFECKGTRPTCNNDDKKCCDGADCGQPACGGNDQACCANRRCPNPNRGTVIVCDNTTTCRACGGKNEPCCEGRLCPGTTRIAPLSCQGAGVGACVPTP